MGLRMGVFDGFKSYEHEINEVRTYLLQERNMRKEYADPFIAAYGKKLGKFIEDGRKKSLQLNTTSSMGAQLNKEFSENDVRFSVLGQAIRGYFSDLRSGKYVNTAVETAIWGIILDEDPQLVNSMKPRLWEFVVNNYGRMAPNADIVFRSEDDSFTGMVSSKSSVPARPVPTRPVATRAPTSNAPKRGLDKKHRVFAALIKMLGNSKASGVLNRLWTNENFRRSLGYKGYPELSVGTADLFSLSIPVSM